MAGDVVGEGVTAGGVVAEDLARAIVEGLSGRGLFAAGDVPTVRLFHDADGKSSYRVDAGGRSIFVKCGVPYWWLVEARIQHAVAGAVPDLALPLVAVLPQARGFAMPFVPPAAAAARHAPHEALAADAAHFATRIGEALGRLHARTSGSEPLARVARANRARMAVARRSLLWNGVVLEPALAATARQLFDTFDRTIALVHGDANLGNVLVGPAGVRLVDFEKAWYGDPAFDCGWMMAAFIRVSLRTRDAAARARLPDVLRGLAGAWSDQLPAADREEAECRAVGIALLRTLAAHQDKLQRTGAPAPPEVLADIDAIRRLALAGPMGVAELAAGLAAPRFHPADGRSVQPVLQPVPQPDQRQEPWATVVAADRRPVEVA